MGSNRPIFVFNKLINDLIVVSFILIQLVSTPKGGKTYYLGLFAGLSNIRVAYHQYLRAVDFNQCSHVQSKWAKSQRGF